MFDLDLLKYGDKPCLIKDNITIAYKELSIVCQRIEDILPKEKQLILIKAKINIETIVGYLSFLRSGHAFIMIDNSIDDYLMNSIIEIYQPNFIWEEIDKNDETVVIRYINYGLKLNNSEILKLNPNLAIMLSTSGTTGSPKMVKLSKQNLYSNCKSIVKYLNIKANHRAITNLPFYYSYGISILNTHLDKGASIVVTDESIMSKEFWNIFNKKEVTTLSGVPYNYEILKRIGFMKMDLPSLKFMTQAGGKLNHKLVVEYANWSNEHSIDFCIMYGQTEATARISYLEPENALTKNTSIGIPIPDGKLKIKDLNSGKYINESDTDGELIYEGENVMMGYATSLVDLSKADELNGVLHTGDIARKDDDGYFYITGRIKRFIKIHGNRVGLDEIEQYLKSMHFDILCTGIDNKLMIATIDKGNIEEIKQMIIEKYSFHHSVVKVKYIDEYPTTSAGKIKYKELIGRF
ncbi:MAG: AMP-binding protein [Campylobacterota bacterium]|nr:AMP-binding protein [Campylobacterota bacterium]